MARAKILMIEDNRFLREGIAAMLEGHGDFEVVAPAEDGDVLRELEKSGKSPDVVPLDLGLEKSNSLQLMALLCTELFEARAIAMDILPEHPGIVDFVEAGGSGFSLESASLFDYMDTIKAVAKGEKVLPTVLTASLFTQNVEFARPDT